MSYELQQSLGKVLLADPAVDNISSFIGADGTNTTLNSGRIQINLKPLEERGLSATDVIRRLNSKLAQVAGIKLYMQPVQDLTVDDRVSRTQYQYTLEDPSPDELTSVVHDLLPKLQALPELADVVTDQQLDGIATTLTIDRATASRFGITPTTIDNTLYDAFGQRQINTMYTQVNQYHVILEADPKFQRDPGNLHDIYIQASNTGTPAAVASSTAGSSSGAGSGSSASSGNTLLTAASSSNGSSLGANSSGVLNLSSTTSLSGTSSTSALSGSSTSSLTTNGGNSAASQSASAPNSRSTASTGGLERLRLLPAVPPRAPQRCH